MAIFHLSIPVLDLEAAIDFYQRGLGAGLGRREERWADVAVFGAQVTLQWSPQDVTADMPRTRHFGATIGWDEWQSFAASPRDFVEPPHIQFAGTDREQAKCMIADPSGNLIEIKAYKHPEAMLGTLASGPGE